MTINENLPPGVTWRDVEGEPPEDRDERAQEHADRLRDMKLDGEWDNLPSAQ